MVFDPELLLALMGAIAALFSALFVFYKWAEEQENAKHEQLRREIVNEVRADIYRHLLELNVKWLSSSAEQRETIKRLADEESDKDVGNQTR